MNESGSLLPAARLRFTCAKKSFNIRVRSAVDDLSGGNDLEDALFEWTVPTVGPSVRWNSIGVFAFRHIGVKCLQANV